MAVKASWVVYGLSEFEMSPYDPIVQVRNESTAKAICAAFNDAEGSGCYSLAYMRRERWDKITYRSDLGAEPA